MVGRDASLMPRLDPLGWKVLDGTRLCSGLLGVSVLVLLAASLGMHDMIWEFEEWQC